MKQPIFVAVFCCLIAVSLMQGQVTTATIYGTVMDPTGATVPGATITIRNTGTGIRSSATSDIRGAFSFAAIPTGSYEVAISAAGFRNERRTGFDLGAGQELRLDFKLELGATADVLVVEASTPLVNAVNAEQTTELPAKAMQELPTARRDWTGLMTLGNGLSTNQERGSLSLNGLPSAGFRFTVDGVDAEGQSVIPSFSAYQNFNHIKGVSTAAVESVTVTKGIASADIASTLSGNVNVTTRSGTNELHGEAFLLNNVEDFNARDQFLSSRSPTTFNQYGGAVGGPIIKNKLFYFGAYEGYQLRSFAAVTGTVPSLDLRTTALAAVPAYKALFDLFPQPNTPVAPGALTGLYQGAGSKQEHENHVTVRSDYYISSSTNASFRYTRGRPFYTEPRIVPGNPRDYNGYSEAGSASLFHVTPRWVFETRFGINYNDVNRLDGLYTLGIPAIRKFMGIDSAGGETLFQGGRTMTWEEDVRVRIGQHSLKFGGSYLRRLGERQNIQVPEIRYANMADLLANIPNQVQVTFGVREFHLRTFNLGFFLQDDWKVSPRLMVNLGMRYDYFAPPSEDEGRLFNRTGPFGLGPFIPGGEAPWNPDRNDFGCGSFRFCDSLGMRGTSRVRKPPTTLFSC